ncbi:MAG: TonB-dependent receptor [Cyclobacteriaceae bacterium]|nr:TonB-dependent receptor [Cyclobacteriaceae bacterium]UYN87979.1 MAG: TonB-dependent receptor [Cyclobacteriaceae bacterium]
MGRLLGLMFFLLPAFLAAQVKLTLIDKASGQVVEGAVIYAQGQNGQIVAQAVTNEAGLTSISIKDFPVQLLTSHLGYEPLRTTIGVAGEYALALDPAQKQLDEVVVTGQFEPQSARQSVYRVRTISMERIQAAGATRLQDVLNTELNIRFSQDLSLGGSNLSLQGLSGQNVKVLMDGVPMIGRQGTGNEININQVNVNSIERIEIVEGPMAVIYGADALAGVINIITKKPESGRWSGSAKLHEETVGTEYGLKQGIHNQSVSLGYSKHSFYTLTDFTHNYFGGWQGSAEDRDKEWHPKTQWLASSLAGFKTDNLDVYYRLDYLNENIYNPGLFSGIEAIDQRYITNRFMHQVQGTYLFSDRLKYNGALSYTDYSRQIQTVTVNKNTGDVRLALDPSLQDLTQFDGLTFRGTFLYKVSEQLSVQPGYDFNVESGSGGRLAEGISSIGDYAFFVSSEIKPNHWLSFRPGVRMVKNTAYDAPPFIPSVNAKFQLTVKHDLRLSYGRGFRAPSLRELYFYFFDASHSIEGNPDLKAELSHSFNASWNAKWFTSSDVKFNTALTGFYNTVDNMIGFGVKPGNANITTYLNIEKFKTTGFTWTNTFMYKQFELGAGIGYTGRYNQLIETGEVPDEFLWSPEINGSASYAIPAIGASVSLFYKYTGRTPFLATDVTGLIELNETEGFHWADLSIKKSLNKKFNLSAGVRNLFDVTRINNMAANGGPVHGGGLTRPVGYGRSYFINLSYNF